MKKFKIPPFQAVMVVLVIGFFVGRHFYFHPKYGDGETAPNFTAQLPSGENFQLGDLKGKYVLLDFWGSWCGPCLAESPQLVRLHKKYQNSGFKDAQGFEIVSIGIERDKRRWHRTIQRLGLSWPYHIADLTNSFKFFDSKIARQFGVRQIPTKFLIDPKGQIVEVNPSVSEVDEFLRQRLR